MRPGLLRNLQGVTELECLLGSIDWLALVLRPTTGRIEVMPKLAQLVTSQVETGQLTDKLDMSSTRYRLSAHV